MRVTWPVLVVCAALGICATPGTDSGAQASGTIGFRFIGSAGHDLTNTCYRLSGSAGQAAPGYSSSSRYSVNAGYWAGAPTTGLDEIFFNSFEDC
jgi:hypothetical protein